MSYWTTPRRLGVLDATPEAHWRTEMLKATGRLPPLPCRDLKHDDDVTGSYLVAATIRVPFDSVTTLSTYLDWLNHFRSIWPRSFPPEIQLAEIGTPVSVLKALATEPVRPIDVCVLIEASPSNTESVPADLDLVSVGLPMPEMLHDCKFSGYPAPLKASFSPGSVVIAIVDTGIGFANARFRNADGTTRFHGFWAMDLPPTAGSTGPVPLGRLLTKAEIDAALSAAGGDDEAVYRMLGVLDPRTDIGWPLAFSRTHGTHVLDIAAGYEPADLDAAKRPIIGVQVPRAIIADTSGAFMHPWLSLALHWIADQASVMTVAKTNVAEEEEAGKRLPLIVNLSYGSTAGPGDGGHPIDVAIDQFLSIDADAHHLVMSAGNSYLSRQHARACVEDSSPWTVTWRIQPDDRTASFLQIWLPEEQYDINSPAQRVEVYVEPPVKAPATSAPSVLDHAVDWMLNGTCRARVYHQLLPRGLGRFREAITIAVAPTASLYASMPTAPPGAWKVSVKNLGPEKQLVEVRVARDDSLPFYRPEGRQSYLVADGYEVYDQRTGRYVEGSEPDVHVHRRGTLNMFSNASGQRLYVIGGYVQCDGTPSEYTSSGRLLVHSRNPTYSAVADDSQAHRGVIAAGTLTGSTFIQSGTSVAAPAFARKLGDTLAAGNLPSDLRNHIQQFEAGSPRGPHKSYDPVDERRHGGGRLKRDTPPPHRRRLEP